MKELTKEMVTFSIDLEEELTPVQVALSEKQTGVDHQAYIHKVLEDDGRNPWLWCCVKVTAKFKELKGTAYLGQCAYESYLDFKKGGYYEQMEEEAFEELKKKVDEIVQGLNGITSELEKANVKTLK